MNQLIMILAINTNDYMKIYKNYSEYFSNFNVFKDIIRSMGWMVMKGLVWLAGLLDYMSENAFSFINFLESKSVTDFFNKLKTDYMDSAVICIIVYGILLSVCT